MPLQFPQHQCPRTKHAVIAHHDGFQHLIDEERVPVTKVFKVERAGRHAGLERLPLDRHNPGPCHLGSTVYSLLEEAHLAGVAGLLPGRSEEHTSELQSLMRNSYAVFCLKKKKTND